MYICLHFATNNFTRQSIVRQEYNNGVDISITLTEKPSSGDLNSL